MGLFFAINLHNESHVYKKDHRTQWCMTGNEHFYFLLPVSRESIVFGSNFRNGDFDGFTRFEVS